MSSCLALLVLGSTVSFTIEKHFCGDTLIGTSVFFEVEKCASEAAEVALEKITKKKCCKDIVDVVEGQDELQKTTFEDLDLEQKKLLIAYVASYVNLFEGLPQQIIPHKDYSPPNIVRDIHILDEVFLI